MINILVKQNKIHMRGHANTAPEGSDIVCAAVSAITVTLIRGLKDIAHMSLNENVQKGDICIEWQEPNDTGKALIDMWFLGICGIAAEYPVINFISDE